MSKHFSFNKHDSAKRRTIKSSTSIPNHIFQEPKKAPKVRYSTLGVDYKIACKVSALKDLLQYKNTNQTISKMLKISLPHFIKTPKDKSIFDFCYRSTMNRKYKYKS